MSRVRTSTLSPETAAEKPKALVYKMSIRYCSLPAGEINPGMRPMKAFSKRILVFRVLEGIGHRLWVGSSCVCRILTTRGRVLGLMGHSGLGQG
jgi:hypothetical protein